MNCSRQEPQRPTMRRGHGGLRIRETESLHQPACHPAAADLESYSFAKSSSSISNTSVAFRGIRGGSPLVP